MRLAPQAPGLLCALVRLEPFKTMVGKYGEVVLSRSGGRVWGGCVSWWETFNNQTSFNVGGGWNVKLCKDRWAGDLFLDEVFSELFLLATGKDAWLVDVWEQDGMGDY